MITISVSYACKYRISFATNYVWTKCGKCYNLKTGRFIKQIYKCGSIGYIIKGRFYTLKKLKPFLEKIPVKEKLPF
jgi:hypothetical protein